MSVTAETAPASGTTEHVTEDGPGAGDPLPEHVDAVVVGAGFAGLYAVHRLRASGLEVLGIEAGSDVGGTWYWNRYPGARCDAVSSLYSFSFDDDLQQEWSWTEKYAGQPEIQSYLSWVADRLDLRRRFVFGTRVASATYGDDERWRIRTTEGREVSAMYCVMASGCLSQAKPPEIDGLEQTVMPVHHTGSWPKEGVDVADRRVAVIGTGSSGIQLIPSLAVDAAQVVVLQRTPSFTVPARNRPTDPDEETRIKRDYAEIRASWRRGELVGAGEELVPGNRFRRTVSVHDETPEQRETEFATRWQAGGPFFNGAYGDILTDPEANEAAATFVRERIAETVDDPATAEILTPRGFPIGAKRLCVDTDYWETFNHDHVEVVDVAADPIARVTDDAVELESGRRIEVDLLACATGFDAMTGALLAVDIRGRGGVRLSDAWRDGAMAYLGLAVPGFPNLFTMTGPGSPSVLGNVVGHIEQHVEYVADLIDESRAEGRGIVEAEQDALDAWAERVQTYAGATLFGKADSWYLGANVPGKPRLFMPFVGGIGAFRDLCDGFRADGWAGFERTAPAGPA